MEPLTLVAQTVAEAPSLLDLFARTFDILLWFESTALYWAPIVLPVIFWRVWMRYVRARFIESRKYVLLELRLPQDTMKSPVAMQAVLDGLYARGGESTFLDRIWNGKVRLWYSFEMVSREGQVRLYIWVRAAFQRTVERMLYAHYPTVELLPVSDYAMELPFSLESHNLYGIDYVLSGPTGLPIKTYTDYNLDQSSLKEEQKVDPMAHVLEFLGSMRKGEHLWIQILARAHKVEDFTYGDSVNTQSYEKLARAAIANIRNKPEDGVVFADGGKGKQLSDEQKMTIKAIQRNMQSSLPWDIGIRVIYVAEHEHFDGTVISGMNMLWQPFSAPGFNKLGSANRGQNTLDYPWQDFNGMRENKMKCDAIDAYRRRSWFHAPYRYQHSIMTSAELATIFHVPGSVAQTPTMQRIESTRASAPANLPT